MNQNALNWISNLRSGKFKQGNGALRMIRADTGRNYCCLGVLCEGMNLSTKPNTHAFIFPMENLEKSENLEYGKALDNNIYSNGSVPDTFLAHHLNIPLGLTYVIIQLGIRMNDSMKMSFPQIADTLEYALNLCEQSPNISPQEFEELVSKKAGSIKRGNT